MDEKDIARLQEALMFTDRRTEELHESVLQLSGRIDSVVKRLAAMEARIDAMFESTADDAAQEEARDPQP